MLVLMFLGIIIVAVAVIFLLSKNQSSSVSVESYPYERDRYLFSPAERDFLKVLEQSVGDKYRIFGKVRLADVIRIKRNVSRSEWRAAFNQISSKHLDFVACDPKDFSIQFAIELDDKSHSKANRRKRDEFLERALATAGIPLFRFPVKRRYSIEEIQRRILQGK